MLAGIERGREEIHAFGSVAFLEHGLASAEQLTIDAFARAKVLALTTLGPLAHTHPKEDDDQAHLRALASLYLMSQLEHAALLPAAELLANVGISGGVSIDLGPASSKLMEFWRDRKQHFSAEERRDLFDRIFNDEFDNLMINLCEALYKLDEGILQPGASNPLEEAKVQTSAEQLSEHLLNHTTGESAFAASDILGSIRIATEILKDPHVEHGFGAHSLWTTVESILRRYSVPFEDITPYVVRGKAGMTIISWLAEAQPLLRRSSQTFVGVDNPAVAAAIDWLNTSLTIEQNKAGHAATPAAPSRPAGA